MIREKLSSHRENAILLLNRGKRGLLQVVFGRTFIILALLALQILALFSIFFQLLADYVPLFFAFSGLISLVMAMIIVNDRRQNPSVKLTWLALILVLPVFAIPFYFFVSKDLGHRLVRRRILRVLGDTRPLAVRSEPAMDLLEPGSRSLAEYLWREGAFPACCRSGARYYPLGDYAFEEMLRQLESAERFIFLEYFIIKEGYMWGRVLEILQRKAAAGVEVRVLYDGTCSIALLPYDYPRKLRALGIQCKMFAPLRVAVSTHYNNRDHRKILVVDGRSAFTGGINLADEYINRTSPHGHWKDHAILVTGEAVRSFTLMFLQMWNADGGRPESYGRYLGVFPADEPGILIPFGSCPFSRERLAEMVYLDMIARAQRYIHIMTPYLILDNELSTALTFAARRGVEVVLILPHIPDKKAIFAVSRSYYPQLLEAGVQIYEYTPGFVHAKLLVSDDRRAVVGTVNFDYRSLYLHYECGVYLEDAPAVGQVEADVQDTLCRCQAVTPADCRGRSLPSRATGWFLRLFAPLL